MRASAASFTCDLTQDGGSAVAAPDGLQVGDTVAVSLPDGVSFSFLISAAPPAGIAGPSANARAFGIRIKNGHASFTVRDTSSAPADSCATCGEGLPLPEPTPTTGDLAPKATTAKLRLADAGTFPLATQKSIVDILVAFDNGAQAYVANKGLTLEAFAQTQIGKMNDVLVTNRLDRYYSYRLAGVCKVDGVYDNIDTVPALIAAGAGAAVSLRAARELYGADTVTLLVDVSGNTLGNSSPLTSQNDVASQHECAFSVCSIRAVDTGKQHTMIHENAHNMGCGHAREQSIINSPFPYGRGYYFKDGNVTRHTIMAYGGDNDASWYFSTSSSEFGFTLGDATNDNARVLRETCGEVAKWRDGAAVALEGMALDGAVLQTSARFPWSVDGNGVLRSFNQTTYAYPCTTPLRATITGPKTLRFKHKSYFGGMSVAGNNYSHFDVLLDDSPVLAQTECTNSWTDAHVDIPDGTHEVVFVFSQRFAMNNPRDYKDGAPEADDAVWLKDLVLVDAKPKDRFDVPGTDSYIAYDSALESWLDEQNFWMYEENNPGATWQDFLSENGENGYANWMNYALGLPTTDAGAKVLATIRFDEQGRVVVSVADALSNARALPGLKVVCTLLATDDLSHWPDSQGTDMNGTTATLSVSGNSPRFYKVRITLASPCL